MESYEHSQDVIVAEAQRTGGDTDAVSSGWLLRLPCELLEAILDALTTEALSSLALMN